MSLVIRDRPYTAQIPIATVEYKDKNKKKCEKYVYVKYDDESDSDSDGASDETHEIKEYKANRGEIIHWHPYVLDEQRAALYISGVSGSGKSSFAAHAIKELRNQKRYKKYPIWFISMKNANDPNAADPAFMGIKDFNPIDIYKDDFLELEFS